MGLITYLSLDLPDGGSCHGASDVGGGPEIQGNGDGLLESGIEIVDPLFDDLVELDADDVPWLDGVCRPDGDGFTIAGLC